jgi:hypothetical protein
MLDIRAAMLSSGFPVTDEVPTSGSDTRAAYLPSGIVGISVGERGVGLDTAYERRRQSRWILSLILGLILAGFGVAITGNAFPVNPLVIVLIIPGSLLCGYALVTLLSTYFRSDVVRVLIKSSSSAGSWSLPPPKSQITIEVSGGSARTENVSVGRLVREVVQDAQVNSILKPLLDRIEFAAGNHLGTGVGMA